MNIVINGLILFCDLLGNGCIEVEKVDMQDKTFNIYGCLLMTFFMLMPQVVLANSSWTGISRVRPYDIFPIVVVVTLAVQTIVIYRLGELESRKEEEVTKTFFVVVLANLFSFLVSYVGENILAWALSPEYNYGESIIWLKGILNANEKVPI